MNSLDQLGQLASSLQCDVRYEEPMKRHTTFKIGGPADLFVAVPNETALRELWLAAREQEVSCWILGKGSNMLVRDEGIRGMVLMLGGDFGRIRRIHGNQILCGAAASMANLCSFALKESLSGLEFAWGIPGSSGGAAFMNAGAYGSEMKHVLIACTHMEKDGRIVTLPAADLDLSYRHRIYENREAVILSLTLQLQEGDPEEISARMDDFIQRRKSKQPLEYPSAGSVFKRPQGQFAGALIERCGLKGTCVGGAMVSQKHAGFIINTGDATCQDVLDLIHLIQETVKKETGVELECEVRAVP